MPAPSTPGRIIVLNGTSSAGKSTLVRALRPLLPGFSHYASDQLADAGFRPLDPAQRTAGRQKFFDGFHRSIAGFAAAGNDLLVEHIVEEQSWADDLAALLAPFDCFWVGVQAPLEVLEQRERDRGDRQVGEARFHLKTHDFCLYDFEVDTSRGIDDAASRIVSAWLARRPD